MLKSAYTRRNFLKMVGLGGAGLVMTQSALVKRKLFHDSKVCG
jgi:hypothetical protein